MFEEQQKRTQANEFLVDQMILNSNTTNGLNERIVAFEIFDDCRVVVSICSEFDFQHFWMEVHLEDGFRWPQTGFRLQNPLTSSWEVGTRQNWKKSQKVNNLVSANILLLTIDELILECQMTQSQTLDQNGDTFFRINFNQFQEHSHAC